MKRIIAFAAALMLAVSGGGSVLPEFAAVSRVYAATDTSSSRSYAYTQNTMELCKHLTVEPYVCAVLKNGKEVFISNEINTSNGSGDSFFSRSIKFSKEDLIAALDKEGKTLDDVDNIKGNVYIGYDGDNFDYYDAHYNVMSYLSFETEEQRYIPDTPDFDRNDTPNKLELGYIGLDQNDVSNGMFCKYLPENDMNGDPLDLSDVKNYTYSFYMKINSLTPDESSSSASSDDTSSRADTSSRSSDDASSEYRGASSSRPDSTSSTGSAASSYVKKELDPDTQKLVDGLTTKQRICAVMNDGKEIDIECERPGDNKKSENRIHDYVNITKEDFDNTLTENGYTIDDFDSFVCYLDVDYSGDDFESLKPKYAVVENMEYDVPDVKYDQWTFPNFSYCPNDLLTGEMKLEGQQDLGKGIYCMYWHGEPQYSDITRFKFYNQLVVKAGTEADSSSKLDTSSRSDDSSSTAQKFEWSENADEEQARSLDYKFDTVMVYTDGTEKKLDIDYDYSMDKNTYSTSYYMRYEGVLSREEMDKVLSEDGKTLKDVDVIEYRLTVANGKTTSYSDEYNSEFGVSAYSNVIIPNRAEAASTYGYAVQGLNTTRAYRSKIYSGDKLTDSYTAVTFNFSLYFSKGKVSKPSEAHKKALLVTYTPSVSILLKDGTEIPTDIKLDMSEGNYENLVFGASIDTETVKKYITDAGKDPADFSKFVGYFSTDYPAGQGITDESKLSNISYSSRTGFTLKPEYRQVTASGSTSIGGSGTIKAKSENIKVEGTGGLEGSVVDADKTNYSADDVVKITLDHVDELTFNIYIGRHNALMSGFDDNGPSTAKKGDVNGDGKVNVTDVAKLAGYVKNIKPLTAEEEARSDLNGDGKINITDVSKLAGHVKNVKPL